MKIVLISLKGQQYRFKVGVFRKSLLYQPLTLTTLAANIPDTLNAKLELIDVGIQAIPDKLPADLVAPCFLRLLTTAIRVLAFALLSIAT